jgi:hypothetical protein
MLSSSEWGTANRRSAYGTADLQMGRQIGLLWRKLTPYTHSVYFTFIYNPPRWSPYGKALWGLPTYYILVGVVVFFFEIGWIIFPTRTVPSTSTRTLFLLLRSHDRRGDTIRILGMRRGFEKRNLRPLLDMRGSTWKFCYHEPLPPATTVTMTVEEMLAFILCPIVYNQYVSIIGTVLFSGTSNFLLRYPAKRECLA